MNINHREEPTRISKSLKDLLLEIIEQEKKRGHESVSFKDASNILVNRIEIAGGLKVVS